MAYPHSILQCRFRLVYVINRTKTGQNTLNSKGHTRGCLSASDNLSPIDIQRKQITMFPFENKQTIVLRTQHDGSEHALPLYRWKQLVDVCPYRWFQYVLVLFLV